jgi:hypothetical protein
MRLNAFETSNICGYYAYSYARGLHGPKFYNFTRLEDHLARPNPSPKFNFKYVDRTPPKPDFLLF